MGNVFHTCLYLHLSEKTLQLLEDPRRAPGPQRGKYVWTKVLLSGWGHQPPVAELSVPLAPRAATCHVTSVSLSEKWNHNDLYHTELSSGLKEKSYTI